MIGIARGFPIYGNKTVSGTTWITEHLKPWWKSLSDDSDLGPPS